MRPLQPGDQIGWNSQLGGQGELGLDIRYDSPVLPAPGLLPAGGAVSDTTRDDVDEVLVGPATLQPDIAERMNRKSRCSKPMRSHFDPPECGRVANVLTVRPNTAEARR
jgi:hypothetical protein